MAHWKTTVAGLLAALAPWAETSLGIPHGVTSAVQTLAVAAMGYFAADASKS